MPQLAFIGAGKMASAIVGGVLNKGIYQPSAIACLCGGDGTGADLAKRTGITHIPSAEKLLNKGQIVVLACKPQQINELPPELKDLTEGSLILSILAGVRLKKLQTTFPKARNIVRCMPNTPGQIGAGVTAYAPLSPLTHEDTQAIEGILSSLGVFMAVEEHHLDAVTAVSGSGPAYLFEFTLAFKAAAIAAGLPENIADTLVRETIIGSAKLMESSSQSPVELRNSVTSKGGTTEAALKTFAEHQGNLHSLVSHAVLSAKNRSIELAK